VAARAAPILPAPRRRRPRRPPRADASPALIPNSPDGHPSHTHVRRLCILLLLSSPPLSPALPSPSRASVVSPQQDEIGFGLHSYFGTAERRQKRPPPPPKRPIVALAVPRGAARGCAGAGARARAIRRGRGKKGRRGKGKGAGDGKRRGPRGEGWACEGVARAHGEHGGASEASRPFSVNSALTLQTRLGNGPSGGSGAARGGGAGLGRGVCARVEKGERGRRSAGRGDDGGGVGGKCFSTLAKSQKKVFSLSCSSFSLSNAEEKGNREGTRRWCSLSSWVFGGGWGAEGIAVMRVGARAPRTHTTAPQSGRRRGMGPPTGPGGAVGDGARRRNKAGVELGG
jgi:hypothetical protein